MVDPVPPAPPFSDPPDRGKGLLVRLSEEEHAILAAESERRGIAVSKLVRQALRVHLGLLVEAEPEPVTSQAAG